jgi:hypothetical protein
VSVFAVLGAAGAALVLTQGEVARPLRDRLSGRLRDLVQCPMCAGWWLGLFAALCELFAALCESAAQQGVKLRGVELIVELGAAVRSAFVASLASALTVALWLALGELGAALSLWRYRHAVLTADETCELCGGKGLAHRELCPRAS